MAKNDEQVNFRMPSELRQRLKEVADENNRTLTAEIVARLEASFAPASLAAKMSGYAIARGNALVEIAIQKLSSEALDEWTNALTSTLEEANALASEAAAEIERRTQKPQAPTEGGNGLRDEPQAPARLDRWAKPKVRPEQPQYPKPKKPKP